ncbi:hypothetical protein GCM10023311_16130 [Flaviramulus aquimarinus]|uniref:HAD family hydrolase n=1 Tax=Flaviramulus aquimarinus TaxID=1170456 RepID=A0ABP9F2L9_9FLAO
MYLNRLKKNLTDKNIKVLFTDYYDTLIHRTVHPNYTIKIWAKFMIIEFGLNTTTDELYFIRQESMTYLCNKLDRNNVEVPYETLIGEIYKRLVNNNIIENINKPQFVKAFESIDLKAETSVQYPNENILNLLNDFKANGGKVYLVSDFYGSKSLFKKMLKHHGILDVFDDVFSSSSLEKSKHSGTIYNAVISQLSIQQKDIMMIGDNKRSDFENATKNGLNAFLLPHDKYLRKNRRNALGDDYKKAKKAVNTIYKACTKKSSMPFTQYIIFYHFFTERLYYKCKKEGVKNLFFLSREGQYLKKLFDSYQDFASIENGAKIKTHYLKISRQASMQINLKTIDKEEFKYLKKEYPELSLQDFLTFFNCPDDIKKAIVTALNIDIDKPINDFFNSSEYTNLKANKNFTEFYKNHKQSNTSDFNAYINSFNANVEEEGIHLVDIGWGGTMQESIFGFFEEKIPVTGYYLGLRYMYDIKEKTQRDGLIFSILPFTNYHDNILMANNQFYEQFSAANHGSAIGYTNKNNGYVLEKHNAEEKWLYDNYIQDHQKQMFDFHLALLKSTETICYDQEMIQRIISKKALISGLFHNRRHLKFIQTLNSGFYQNIGTNKVGISYKKEEGDGIMKYILTFLLTPELVFRYITKLKPILYEKNKILAALTPTYFIYFYFLLNRYIRFKVLKNSFLLKSTYFKDANKI